MLALSDGRRGRARVTLAIIGVAFAIASAANAQSPKAQPLEIVTGSGVHHFQVEVAATAAARERGLMFRRSLAPDRGMLFDFKRPQSVSFWMKNTLIPLDMLFIGADGRILSIARNAAPMNQTPIPSAGAALAVLELKGGRAAEIGAEPGDKVRERIFPK